MAIHRSRIRRASAAFVCLAAVLSLPAVPVRAELVFDNPVLVFDHFEEPRYIAAGDLDNDGTDDLVVGNSYAAGLYAFLGTGGGEFQAPIRTKVSPGPLDLADFDGDGWLDIVMVGGYPEYGLALLLGRGDGTFSPPIRLAERTFQSAVLPYDFTGDGTMDLASQAFEGVSFRLGLGGGGLGPATTYPPAGQSDGLDRGDFDGDGREDIAALISWPQGVFSVLHGDGAGGFSLATQMPAPPPGGLVCGDLDADGDDDCLVGTRALLSDGVGGFASGGEATGGERPALLEDMTGDGHLDAVMNHGRVFPGDGHGSFGAARSFHNGGGGPFSAVADFNGDGTRDIATANPTWDTVSVLIGNGDGSSGRHLAAGDGPAGVARADFNHDGLDDLVIVNAGSKDVSVFLQTGGGFGPGARYSVGLPCSAQVSTGDLSGDGHVDLAVSGFGCLAIGLLWGDGAGGFSTPATIIESARFTRIAVADATGDGVSDLLRFPRRMPVEVLPSLGGGVFGSAVTTPSLTVDDAVTGDFNQDGTLDLLGNVDDITGPHALPAAGNGDGTFTPLLRIEYEPSEIILDGVELADLNADSTLDALLLGGRGWSVALGNGIDFGAPVFHDDRWAGIGRAEIADFTGDGTVDLLTDGIAGVLVLQRGLGDGTFERQGGYGVGRFAPQEYVAIEATGDGRMDVAVPLSDEGLVSLLVNRVNRAPVARVGDDQITECGDAVILDGAASFDPDAAAGEGSGIASYQWFEDFGQPGQTLLAEGAQATARLPVGVHTITLQVTDPGGKSSTDDLVVTVADTLPPAGGITAPAAGSCHGPGAVPVVLQDDFVDPCSDAIRRTYAPAGTAGPGAYDAHGDHVVTVTALDTWEHAASGSVSFTIDLEAPVVAWQALPPGRWSVSQSLPLASRWVADDDDGAAGGIAREVLYWDRCPVLDGATWGTTRDGLLSNETIRLDRSLACRALEVCGASQWRDPVLKVEVTDCGGNRGSDELTIPGRISVSRDSCGLAAPERPTRVRPTGPAPGTAVQRGGRGD